MPIGTLITQARQRAGLSKRELARRAATSPAAIVAYEFDRRDPSVSTLQRVLAAAGCDLELVVRPRRLIDATESGRRLVEVLELAEHLPHRPADDHLDFPVLPT